MDSDQSDSSLDETVAGDLDPATAGKKPEPEPGAGKHVAPPVASSGSADGTVGDRIGTRIGRYVIKSKLGRGGYGEVFLAEDESLRRPVALKVVNRGSVDESHEGLLEEGRTLAQLHHPSIVSVFDVGVIESEDKLFFVSQFVEGRTLRQTMREGPMDANAAARLVAMVAEALSYAHARSIVHRDIKPTNIIINEHGEPILIDFGIAWSAGQTMPDGVRAIVGSVGYMSPEQARGESHLVDGRSDIYSLGVILYEMLSGKRPFEGRSEDVIEQVASSTVEVCPPRQVDASIPRALERVCLKALAKRTNDRYSTANDLAEDLRAFAESSAQHENTGTKTFRVGGVIPKGLRSFDGADSDFFLQLLPGLRDQAGIPDGIQFWKRGIENRVDPFRVGVLYGPSGSGKSSFLKAGLVPLLPESVEVIYVAADSTDTEARLRERLYERFSSFGPGMSATDCLRQIREKKLIQGGGKLLIVIDQFEQWLHSRGRTPDSDMVSALRQCDGKSVQVLLTVRDEFWMAIGQFMDDIDVELLQSQNAAAIDLFDHRHARNVLIAFGEAYERLPGGDEGLSDENRAFIDAAIADMQHDGKIIPLQLSLFAEMAKTVDWTAEAYQRLGGATAIGVEFLNSVFVSPLANPAHRAVEKPARAILEALLPPGDDDIRGRALSDRQLREKAGLSTEADRFSSTVRILDSELKLISPIDIVAGEHDSPERGRVDERHYQLTHDYLVPALRDWLFETRKSTMAGRSLLRLKELAAAWRSSGDRRHLPSFREWLRIRLLVPRAGWEESERHLLVAASRIHLRTAGVALAVLAVVLVAGLFVRHRIDTVRLSDRVLATPVENGMTPGNALDEVGAAKRKAVLQHLDDRLKAGQLTNREALAARLLLIEKDEEHAAELFAALPDSSAAGCAVYSDAIGNRQPALTAQAWLLLDDADASSQDKLRYAAFLAHHDPDSQRWSRYAEENVQWIVSSPLAEVAQWSRQFYPVREHFLPILEKGINDHSDGGSSAGGRLNRLATALINIAGNDPVLLRNAFMHMPGEEVRGIADAIAVGVDDAGFHWLDEILASSLTSPEEQARAAALRLRLGPDTGPWGLFGEDSTPAVRSFLIHEVSPVGLDADIVLERMKAAEDAFSRHLLIQCLGTFPAGELTLTGRREALDWLRRIHLEDPDSGVHASSRWLLAAWGEELPTPPSGRDAAGERRWFYNQTGMPFAVIDPPPGGVSRMAEGSSLAIGMTEVTSSQYATVAGNAPGKVSFGDRDEKPVSHLSLDTAIRFCILLTRKEGLAESEQCYREVDGAFMVVEDFFQKTGYRLPTSAEWRHASRGGDDPPRYFGKRDQLTVYYAWNAGRGTQPIERVALLKPNGYGLFDTLGNVSEWSHNERFFSDRSRPILTGFMSGGSVESQPARLSRETALDHDVNTRLPVYGFRVARILGSWPIK